VTRDQADILSVEQAIRSDPILAASFLGLDERPLGQIIAADMAELAALGITHHELARRMMELTAIARQNMETPVTVGGIEVYCQQWKGHIACPWPGCGLFEKTLTVARRLDRDADVGWTDLNTHLIAWHGFFEGKGSPFRLEPQRLVRVLC